MFGEFILNILGVKPLAPGERDAMEARQQAWIDEWTAENERAMAEWAAQHDPQIGDIWVAEVRSRDPWAEVSALDYVEVVDRLGGFVRYCYPNGRTGKLYASEVSAFMSIRKLHSRKETP